MTDEEDGMRVLLFFLCFLLHSPIEARGNGACSLDAFSFWLKLTFTAHTSTSLLSLGMSGSRNDKGGQNETWDGRECGWKPLQRGQGETGMLMWDGQTIIA